jgi:hypothetical protein
MRPSFQIITIATFAILAVDAAMPSGMLPILMCDEVVILNFLPNQGVVSFRDGTNSKSGAISGVASWDPENMKPVDWKLELCSSNSNEGERAMNGLGRGCTTVGSDMTLQCPKDPLFDSDTEKVEFSCVTEGMGIIRSDSGRIVVMATSWKYFAAQSFWDPNSVNDTFQNLKSFSCENAKHVEPLPTRAPVQEFDESLTGDFLSHP